MWLPVVWDNIIIIDEKSFALHSNGSWKFWHTALLCSQQFFCLFLLQHYVTTCPEKRHQLFNWSVTVVVSNFELFQIRSQNNLDILIICLSITCINFIMVLFCGCFTYPVKKVLFDSMGLVDFVLGWQVLQGHVLWRE